MMPNFLITALSALVPLLIGFVWYNPKVFGTVWMKAAGMTEDSMKGANMGLIFGLSFVLSFIFGLGLNFMVIHQYHLFSLLAGDPEIHTAGSNAANELKGLMDSYGTNFRTFGHGALHGAIASLLFFTPIFAVNSLFERKGFKYIAINGGYWTVVLTIMGGIICGFS